jgi:hypothetical protein
MNIGIHIVQNMFNIVPKRNKVCAFYGSSLFELFQIYIPLGKKLKIEKKKTTMLGNYENTVQF